MYSVHENLKCMTSSHKLGHLTNAASSLLKHCLHLTITGYTLKNVHMEGRKDTSMDMGEGGI